jgi:hypothetical protein
MTPVGCGWPGRTEPLPRDARPAIGALLRAADQSHPWPPVLAPARFGAAAPVEYTRVEPTVVVEIAVDAAVDLVRGRPVWRRPATFRRCGTTYEPTISAERRT